MRLTGKNKLCNKKQRHNVSVISHAIINLILLLSVRATLLRIKRWVNIEITFKAKKRSIGSGKTVASEVTSYFVTVKFISNKLLKTTSGFVTVKFIIADTLLKATVQV